MLYEFLSQPTPYLAFAAAVAFLLFVAWRQGGRIKRLEERTNLPSKDLLSSTVSAIQNRKRPSAARRRKKRAEA